MILLTLQIDVLKKNHPEFLQTLIGIGDEVRKLPGCISYQIYQYVETDNMLCLEIEWSNDESMRTYVESKNYSIIIGAIKTFGGTPQIKLGEIIRVEHHDLLDNKYQL